MEVFLIFLIMFIGTITLLVFAVKKLKAQKKKATDLGAKDYLHATYICINQA